MIKVVIFAQFNAILDNLNIFAIIRRHKVVIAVKLVDKLQINFSH